MLNRIFALSLYLSLISAKTLFLGATIPEKGRLRSEVVVDGWAACTAACHAGGPGSIRFSEEKVAIFWNPASGTRSQALQLRLLIS
jgi:hypothetical protein